MAKKAKKKYIPCDKVLESGAECGKPVKQELFDNHRCSAHPIRTLWPTCDICGTIGCTCAEDMTDAARDCKECATETTVAPKPKAPAPESPGESTASDYYPVYYCDICYELVREGEVCACRKNG